MFYFNFRVYLFSFLFMKSCIAYGAFAPIYTCQNSGSAVCLFSSYSGIQFPDGTLQTTAASGGGGGGITALTGDGAATGPGSAALTLSTVNTNTGAHGSSTSIPNFTVNGKGLITAAGGNAVIAPAGTLTGSTLSSGVTASSLTSLGTITSGVWNGTAIAIANGGTGQTSKANAFNALSPITTTGDIIYGSASNVSSRLGIGGTGTVLGIASGVPAYLANLYDASAVKSVDFAGRNLMFNDGTTSSIDWNGGFIRDTGGAIAVYWPQRYLTDHSQFVSIDWDNRIINDEMDVVALNYQSGGLGGRYLADDSGNPQLIWSNGFGMTIVNALQSYNGNATVGNGLTTIVGYIDLTSQTDSITTTTLFTTLGIPGTYTATVYLLTTNAGSAGTVTATIGWTDSVTSRTMTSTPVSLSTNDYTSIVVPVFSGPTQDITYSTTVTSAVGSPTYELVISLTRQS